jgi:hypothetical protein
VINFERGIEPKKVLGIGWEKVLEEMGGILIREDGLYRNLNNPNYDIREITIHNIRGSSKLLYEAYIIIIIIGDQFRIMKSRVGPYYNRIGPVSKLPSVVLDFKKKYDVWKDSR